MASKTPNRFTVRVDVDVDLTSLVREAFDECEASTEQDVNNDLNSISNAQGGVPVYPMAPIPFTATGTPVQTTDPDNCQLEPASEPTSEYSCIVAVHVADVT
jgi:hypothetical protein